MIIINYYQYQYIFNTLYDLALVLSIKSTMSIKLYELYHQKDIKGLIDFSKNDLSEVIDNIEQLYKDFKYQWMLENKSFGFEVQSYRFGGLVQRLKDVRSEIDDYINHHNDKIEALEVRILNLANEDDPYLGCIYYNQFAKYVTFGTF